MGKRKASIIQKEKECYLCRMDLGMTNVQNLELHHCMNAFNRKKSDEDGLTVWLCGWHHDLLHDTDASLATRLKAIAEQAWIDAGNGDVDEWIKRYSKNYI